MYNVSKQREIVKSNLPFKNEALKLTASRTYGFNGIVVTQYQTNVVPEINILEAVGPNAGFIANDTVEDIASEQVRQAYGVTGKLSLKLDTLVRLGLVRRITNSMR